MKKSLLGASLLGCAMLAVTPAIANHSWNNYHWARSSKPLQLRVERQLTAQWESSFSVAITDWDQSKVLDLAANASNLGISSKKCSAVPGKVLVCNDAYGRRGWLGIASIWLDGQAHITQATTKLNDSYHDSAPYNSPAWRALVMCQEIGHDFGLDHQDENFSNANLDTCMDYTNDPASNQHPNAHDYEQLADIYAHLDSYDTASAQSATNFGQRALGRAAPAATDSESGDGPAEWGTAVHRDAQGRPDVFVKALGQGHKKVTHVFWAVGEGPRGRSE